MLDIRLSIAEESVKSVRFSLRFQPLTPILNGGEGAGVGDVGLRDWSNVLGWDCGNSDRRADEGHELDLIGTLVGIDMDDHAHIAGLKPFVRYVHSQDN